MVPHTDLGKGREKARSWPDHAALGPEQPRAVAGATKRTERVLMDGCQTSKKALKGGNLALGPTALAKVTHRPRRSLQAGPGKRPNGDKKEPVWKHLRR